jgi:hypothetical protein
MGVCKMSKTFTGVNLQLRIDTTANWNNKNPVLLKGEVGIESTTSGQTLIKIGDGTTKWQSLKYFAGNYNDLFNQPIVDGQLQQITTAVSNTSYSTAQLRNVILSPDAPSSSEGSNGDIWIKYTV